jgi:hypothetical protein
MKKLIILTASFIFALAIMSCKKSGWETMTEDHYYVLVRPLIFDAKALDNKQNPIKTGVWYLARPTSTKVFSGYSSSRYLELVSIEETDLLVKGMIEDCVATIDTIFYSELSKAEASTGFRGIESAEFILLRENFYLEANNSNPSGEVIFRLKAD